MLQFAVALLASLTLSVTALSARTLDPMALENSVHTIWMDEAPWGNAISDWEFTAQTCAVCGNHRTLAGPVHRFRARTPVHINIARFAAVLPMMDVLPAFGAAIDPHSLPAIRARVLGHFPRHGPQVSARSIIILALMISLYTVLLAVPVSNRRGS